jgi:hypothetical protein
MDARIMAARTNIIGYGLPLPLFTTMPVVLFDYKAFFLRFSTVQQLRPLS